ncbi:DUF302 domain-containing protein [Tepidibacillus sp. LV47]|uniref:DUF302 domain-containing protein n=1 Tax=Tepidibacillus sp. LV47 TaxID=3398228 RepID=UPI003AAF74BB
MKQDHYHVTFETKKELEQVIADLEKELKEIRFGVLWRFDIHQKLSELELPIEHKIVVLEVCNPNESSGIIAADPMSSYFLPCKIVVSEQEGQTKVGLVRPSILIGLMEQENLTEIAKKIEDKLIQAIENAV